MTKGWRSPYLYLALACFLGIIAIFVFDGYLGIYDSMSMKVGERDEKVPADYWLRQDYYWSTGIQYGDKVSFSYTIENRMLPEYRTNVEVSVFQAQTKALDLLSESVTVPSFGKKEITWVLDSSLLTSPEAANEPRLNECSVTIKRGQIERKIVLYISPSPYPPKMPIPIPAPVR